MTISKKLLNAFVAVLLVGTVVSCKKDKDDDDDVIPVDTNTTVLSGTLNTNKTLTADKVWTLKGYVYVPNGVTLTIEPGTVIKGDTIVKGALCIERGGKIMANGTAGSPIVFTSGRPAGQRTPGDWGGIVICGRARTNRSTTPVIEGGLDRPYGGTDDADNSGVMRYVRIEYAGVAEFPGSEINGLTLAGVGNGTTLEYIQVAYGNDDAFEFFGGTVNAKNLVAFATADDDFDFDFGYRGNLQFGVALRDPMWVDNGDAGNGIECDNDGSGSAVSPYTRPVISNFTFVGPNGAAGTLANHNYGNRWRRASQFVLRNSIMMGWMKGGFSIESSATADSLKNGNSEFKNNLVHAMMDAFRKGSDVNASIFADNAAVEAFALNATNANTKYNTAAEIMLSNPFNLTNPNLMPAGGSPALNGGNFTGLPAFFTPTTYRGAMGGSDWMAGWTRFFSKGQ